MLKIRRPLGRLIFNMGIAIPGKTVFLIETAPWWSGTCLAPGHHEPSCCWVNFHMVNHFQVDQALLYFISSSGKEFSQAWWSLKHEDCMIVPAHTTPHTNITQHVWRGTFEPHGGLRFVPYDCVPPMAALWQGVDFVATMTHCLIDLFCVTIGANRGPACHTQSVDWVMMQIIHLIYVLPYKYSNIDPWL